MKKNWKERLYDFCMGPFVSRVYTILLILALACFVTSFFVIEYKILAKILICSFFILPVLGMQLNQFCITVRDYNKETFLCNKVKILLFADGSLISWVAFVVLAIIFAHMADAIFPAELSYIQRIIYVLGGFLIAVISFVIGKLISKYCKKKIVHIETDEDNKKVY